MVQTSLKVWAFLGLYGSSLVLCCPDCGRNSKRPLRLCAVVYGNQKFLHNQQQVNFRVYICETSPDVQKCIGEMETPINGSQQSQYKPLSVHNENVWEITLTSLGKTPWTLHEDDNKTQIIPMNVCYNSSVIPPSVDFRCILKDSSNPMDGIEASFKVAQFQTKRRDMVFTELITQDFNCNVPKTYMHAAGLVAIDPATDQHLNYIQTHLEAKDLPRFARALGLSNPEFSAIRHDIPSNIMEQTYQVLNKWKTKKGPTATLSLLCKTLVQLNINEIAHDILKVVPMST